MSDSFSAGGAAFRGIPPQQWQPWALIELAQRMSCQLFANAVGPWPAMLVKLAEDQPSVEGGLASNSGLRSIAIEPQPDPLAFRTVQRSASEVIKDLEARRGPQLVPNGETLADAVREVPHFIVPIRKRGATTAGATRVSVGRTGNMDIILRHTKVSKFHAWLFCDPVDGLHVEDAGSTNRTVVNGQTLGDERVALQHGDALHFGSVETYICDVSVLWEALRG